MPHAPLLVIYGGWKTGGLLGGGFGKNRWQWGGVFWVDKNGGGQGGK